jgi:hypothetical protein
MKFKFLTLALVVVLSTTTVLTSCGKYDEGPSFTLLTKKMRITGEWTLIALDDDEVDPADGFESKLLFEGDGTFTQSTNFNGVVSEDVGTWEFNSDKTALLINETEATIIKLKNKEMKLRIAEIDFTYSKD